MLTRRLILEIERDNVREKNVERERVGMGYMTER